MQCGRGRMEIPGSPYSTVQGQEASPHTEVEDVPGSPGQITDLGLVPLLGFRDVLSRNGLVLSPDVPEGCCEVWLGHVHLHLDLLLLKLGLKLTDLLQDTA